MHLSVKNIYISVDVVVWVEQTLMKYLINLLNLKTRQQHRYKYRMVRFAEYLIQIYSGIEC